ncbi:MAG TPA: class I SAM-dependent methyltransferase [Candidatus Polarisedimenticolia bacterium]|nr:class I SAM-dependent methyltransferase [Candidatus Polarisedimenticolia bacterium]
MDLRWYETFFRGVALDFWRQAVPPDQSRLEAEFLAAELKLPPGGHVLDIPCGSGRHALALASLGYRVTGLDLSHEQIEEARRLSAEAGLRIEWREGDMKDLEGSEEVDGAYCMGNSFGYMPPEETHRFIAAVARSLKPGGRFVMDTGMAAESILSRLKDREWAPVGEILFLEENRYLLAESCIETTYTFVRRGETIVRTGLQWVYTLRELRALLGGEGLRVESIYRGVDRVPFELSAPYLILSAQKQAT